MNRFLITSLAVLLVVLAGAPLSAQSARPSQNVPDVYVAANNSFVITVPNLSKVAVGNPTAVIANVISPTEVLVQGHQTVTKPGDGIINFATSNVFVWSGDRRYVYRVVVIETTDTALPYGVDRLDVEPNRVIVRGNSPDLARTQTECRRIFDSLGVKYELKVTEFAFTDVMQTYMNVTRPVLEDAIARKIVLVGMTMDDLRRSQGSIPSVYYSSSTDTRIIDFYRYPDYDVAVANGVVVNVQRRVSVPETVVAEAAEHGIVLVNMTDTEMIRVLGAPSAPPTVTEKEQDFIYEYAYPQMRVITRNGRVTEVQPNHPLMPSSIDVGRRDLGSWLTPAGLKLAGRAYRLKYISGAEMFRSVEMIVKTWSASEKTYICGYTADGLFAVVSEPYIIEVLDSMVTVWDRPMPNSPIAIQETKYTIPAGRSWDAVNGAWQDVPAKDVGFVMARFSSGVAEARRKAIADELASAVAALPTIPFAATPSINLSGATLTITGTPEQVDLIKNILSGMIPDVIGKDLNQAVEAGILLPGMTRQQVEAARGVTLDATGRRMDLADGSLAWIYDAGDRAVLLSEDVLVEERLYPSADEVRNAVQEKSLVPYLLKQDVERILGQPARRSTQNSDGTMTVVYDFGEAVYWKNRLESMNGLAGSEMQRLGISVGVPRTDDQDFQVLTADEQQLVMRRGVVMTGMSERDVARVVGQAPFNIRPGAMPSEKIYVYSDYEVTFRNGLATQVTPIGDGTPRIITLKSRRATDMVSLILSSFATMSDVGLSADTISNRLIVRAPSDKFVEIERFAKAMDQQEIPQVLIEAKFVELNRAVVKQLGVQWGLSGQSDAGNRPFGGFGGSSSRTDATTQPSGNLLTGTTGGAGTQTISLGADAGMLLGMFGGNGFSFGGLRYTNIDVMISALESSGDAEVLSSPRIVTINNQSASLKSIERVYDVNTTQTIDGVTGTTSFSTTTTPKDVGIQLTVNPTIGQDGIITLDLNAIVSRVTNRRNYGAGTNVIIINEISERNSQSRVMVRSGTPLVIGGLSSRDSVRSQQQVPFLGSLPILGHLFRTDRNSGTDVDLLIFLTARIVPPDGTVSEVDSVIGQPRPVIPNPPPPSIPAPAAAQN